MRHGYLTIALTALAAGALGRCAAALPGEGDERARQTVVDRELQKWDLFFGTPSERQAVLAWYADDFLNIAPGHEGRADRASLVELARELPNLPQLPPGTYRIGETTVIPVERGYIVSMLVAGPGVGGEPTTFWSTSVWALRGGEWKSVFYQNTPR